jgi:hypothetical protein
VYTGQPGAAVFAQHELQRLQLFLLQRQPIIAVVLQSIDSK